MLCIEGSLNNTVSVVRTGQVASESRTTIGSLEAELRHCEV